MRAASTSWVCDQRSPGFASAAATDPRGVCAGINQPVLDTPEALWKSYIDFEARLREVANVRKLYARLLERTKHVKVRALMLSSLSRARTCHTSRLYLGAADVFRACPRAGLDLAGAVRGIDPRGWRSLVRRSRSQG